MTWARKWKIREYVLSSLWLIPALFAVAAIFAGTLLPDLDKTYDEPTAVRFSTGAATSVLSSIAAGMITFTGFVFSIMLVAVQFGSSQFSPRLLRTFQRDSTTKVALGVFIMTFTYSLLVLSDIGSKSNDFVPSNSVSLAILLLLASVAMFLKLIHNVTQGLRVATVVSLIGKDARGVIDTVYPDPAVDPSKDREEIARSTPDDATRTVRYLGKPGVLQSIDARGLVKMASKADAVLELIPAVGDFLPSDSPLFHVHDKGHPIAENTLRTSIGIGDERTLRQDPAFAFRLLADISSKALSPGVNDPSTSIQALDQIDELLRIVANRRLIPGVIRDREDRIRLKYRTPAWEDFISLAVDETRQFGEGSVQVARRLRALLEDLLEVVPLYRQPAVLEKLQLLQSSVHRGFSDEEDRVSAATSDRQGIGSSRVGV